MPEKHNKKKRVSPTTTAAIGALLTLVGGFFLFYNYIESKKIVAYDYMANVFYNGTEIVPVTELQEVSEEEDNPEPLASEDLPGEVTN